MGNSPRPKTSILRISTGLPSRFQLAAIYYDFPFISVLPRGRFVDNAPMNEKNAFHGHFEAPALWERWRDRERGGCIT
jgi:hypothetical protein